MSDFSFLAMPNIEGIRVLGYIRLLGGFLLFGVSLFFVLYFLLNYRRQQKLVVRHKDFDQKTQQLHKEMLAQKFFAASDTMKLVLFIEYVEKFVTTRSYMDVSSLLLTQGFTPEEIQALEQVLYIQTPLSKVLEDKLHHIVTAS